MLDARHTVLESEIQLARFTPRFAKTVRSLAPLKRHGGVYEAVQTLGARHTILESEIQFARFTPQFTKMFGRGRLKKDTAAYMKLFRRWARGIRFSKAKFGLRALRRISQKRSTAGRFWEGAAEYEKPF